MRRILLLAVVLLSLPRGAAAQGLNDFWSDFFGIPSVPARQEKPVALTWDLLFDWTFLNDEIRADSATDMVSGTMAGARITPFAGVRIDRNRAGVHRVMGGVDLFKEFGTQERIDFGELLLYYRYDNRFRNTGITAALGSFPRALTEGAYDRSVFSEAVRFYDPNLDGMLLQVRRPRSFYEICLDWNGMYGYERREEFNVFTWGETRVGEWLALGWQGIFHHYANSVRVRGVVDDHLLNPWIRLDASGATSLQALSLQAGPVLMYQRDRRYEDVKAPFGLKVVTDIRKWNLGILNDFYYGGSMVPLYNTPDASGSPFASALYMRSLKATPCPGDTPGIADILSFYWAPRLGEFVSLRISADVLFNRGYAGLDQYGTLIFHLDRIGRKDRPARARRTRKPSFNLPI